MKDMRDMEQTGDRQSLSYRLALADKQFVQLRIG